MNDLTLDDLVIRVDLRVPGSLRLEWVGCSDGVNPRGTVGPFFAQVLAEARRTERRIDMHFEKLEYFNSATIATLVQLIRLTIEANVALCIHYCGQLEWQALSFEALERVVHSSAGARGRGVEFLSAHP